MEVAFGMISNDEQFDFKHEENSNIENSFLLFIKIYQPNNNFLKQFHKPNYKATEPNFKEIARPVNVVFFVIDDAKLNAI
ncbi:MAG: hypothetical protein ACI85I_002359 [Arenicella sp.]|jgi:hypothetical protein